MKSVEQILESHSEKLDEIRGLVERIIRIEERNSAMMETVKRMHERIDGVEKSAVQLQAYANVATTKLESLVWAMRLLAGAVLTGFIAGIFTLFKN